MKFTLGILEHNLNVTHQKNDDIEWSVIPTLVSQHYVYTVQSQMDSSPKNENSVINY